MSCTPAPPIKRAGGGFHLFPGAASEQVFQIAQRLFNEKKPLRVMTVINDKTMAARLKPLVDYLVFRDVPGPGDPDNPTEAQYASGNGAAWLAGLLPRYAGLVSGAYIQPMNEGKWHPNAGAFWVSAMKYADSLGLNKLAILAYSIGNPNDENGTTRFEKWSSLTPALTYAKANGHIVVLHAYAAPGTTPGQLTPESNRENFEGRFVKLWASVPETARPILVFGEVGCEFTRGKWQGRAECVSYADAHLAYVRPYPYVAGDALWTVNGQGYGWEDASINEALPDLEALYRARYL